MSGGALCVAITGGKGGVGKTALTSNLAFGLAALGRRVLLLDADYALANLDVALGLNPRYNLRHVFFGERSLREILVEGACGLRLIPAASGLPVLADLQPLLASRLLEELSELRQEADILLVDTAAGIGRSVTDVLGAADRILLVTTPDPAAIVDAYALTKLLRTDHSDKPVKLVVNQVRTTEEGEHVHHQIDRASRNFLGAGLGYLGSVPADPALARAMRLQQPLLETEPGSPAGASLGRMVLALDAELSIGAPRPGNLVSFWGSLFSASAGTGGLAVKKTRTAAVRPGAGSRRPERDAWTPDVCKEGSPARDRFVLQHAPIVRYIAARLASRLPPGCEIGDLIGDGLVGLLQAINRFNPSRDVSFETFASSRVRGAMLDGLRSRDLVPRSVRRGQRRLKNAVEQVEARNGKAATEEEIAAELGLDASAFARHMDELRGIQLLPLLSDDDENQRGIEPPAPGRSPHQVLERRETLEALAQVVETLGKRERLVLSLYYEEELTMREIGEVLGVTESRICQIHTTIVARIAARMSRGQRAAAGGQGR